MNFEVLTADQAYHAKKITEQLGVEPTPAEQRAEYLAMHRERRQWQFMRSAVFWGVFKAQLLLIVLGVASWLLLLLLTQVT